MGWTRALGYRSARLRPGSRMVPHTDTRANNDSTRVETQEAW